MGLHSLGRGCITTGGGRVLIGSPRKGAYSLRGFRAFGVALKLENDLAMGCLGLITIVKLRILSAEKMRLPLV